ncbi:ribonuclease 3-like protein 1 [Senna tora]|uniref:Ribonuclease 3-like protein 1 n=1 Tax=Senna tora TaxID=362788 RepID=A0A834XH93_9FABA|nr:ribonuclease 3-like protein 1 [Senna tora]
MDNKYSDSGKLVINLKHLPPLDPVGVTNSSYNVSTSSSRAAPKFVKPNPNRAMKFVKSDEASRKSRTRTLSNVDGSSDSSCKTSEARGNTTSDTDSVDEGMKQGSARSNLYEICAASHWKRPIFECCKEEGPSHRRKFTFKVVLEIEAAPETIIECYGSPHQKKKRAADHAAEGALWYLKHLGHVKKNK